MFSGRGLSIIPQNVPTLSEMELEHCGCVLLMIRAAEWLGKRECDSATDQEQLLLRLLVPVIELYTAKQGVAVSSELHSFWGTGIHGEFRVALLSERSTGSADFGGNDDYPVY